jgi:hypothetical protein
MKQINCNRLLAWVSTAALFASGIAVAQQPAPMPMKPEKPAAAEAKPGVAPTASQGIDSLFKRIDTDADGSLSKVELEKFDPEAAKSFDKYDTDKDAKLSLSEFDAMVKGLRGG